MPRPRRDRESERARAVETFRGWLEINLIADGISQRDVGLSRNLKEGENMHIKVSEDELPGINREEDGDYTVPLAQVPLAVEGLRNLADKLEEAYSTEKEL